MTTQPTSEPYAWESTTPCYIRFITHSRYLKFRPYARRWYRPICPCVKAAMGEFAGLDGEVE